MLTNCPVCDAASQFDLFENTIDQNGNLTEIMICPHCSVLHNTALQKETPNDSDRSAFQASAVQSVYSGFTTNIENTRKNVIATLPIIHFLFEQPDIKVERGTYLEIGAGAGFLAAASSSFFKRVFAVELDSREAAKTFSLMHLKNARALQQISEFDPAANKADCVVLWHTLEHIPRPRDFLADLKTRMAAGGVLYFQVPLYRKQNVFPAHIWFFNARCLGFLRVALGFSHQRLVFDTTNDFISGIFW